VNLRRVLLPAFLIASASLTACSGDDSSSGASSTDDGPGESPSATTSASGPADACGLLTADEVAAAVGGPVKAGIASSGPAVTGGSFSSCVWPSADPDDPADTATVTVYPNADAADSARESDAQELPGIGDKAFTGSFASVWVYVGDQSLFAQWYALSGSDADSLPKSQALAEAAAEAL
jgi:hypothetical protein